MARAQWTARSGSSSLASLVPKKATQAVAAELPHLAAKAKNLGLEKLEDVVHNLNPGLGAGLLE